MAGANKKEAPSRRIRQIGAACLPLSLAFFTNWFPWYNSQLGTYPTPISLTHNYSWGSQSGLWFITQVLTGLFLAASYIPHYDEATASIETISRDGFHGWFVHYAHSNGASCIFAAIYCHMARSILLSNRTVYAWLTGTILLILMILSAFLGYVLVWTQMSYWAATVITSILTVLPAGKDLLHMVWGSICIDQSTLSRFFAWHYLVALLTFAIMIVHIFAVHYIGSTGVVSQTTVDKVPFIRWYVVKDGITFAMAEFSVVFALYCIPVVTADAELFIPINTMSTPHHIVPEWYLLSFYAMLRCIPDKLYGIITVAIFFILLVHHTIKDF